jgi:hypothetical protein
VETLEAQAATVNSARVFAGHKPLVVSPVTLKQQVNPVATGPEPAVPTGELPWQVDPRQRTLFGAAWTLGSLAALATAGVDSVTFYETAGWRGVMENEAGSPLPRRFPSLPGEVFPVFHVFAAVAGIDLVAPVDSASRRAALALLNAPDCGRLLLANLTSEPLEIRLASRSSVIRMRVLDETNLLAARHQPTVFLAQTRNVPATSSGWVRLALAAHAFACLDLR